MTVYSETVQFARASPGSEVIPMGGDRFTHYYQTLYQSLPELRSSERVKAWQQLCCEQSESESVSPSPRARG